ncbi:MAG: hypothetical protein ABSF35_04115 [Polyangia bacterium]|jgi:hypothetical protein
MNHFLDPQVGAVTVIALVPNLLIILWAVARLSHDLRLLKQKNAMLEDDINLLDQSISSLTGEFQAIRQIENRKTLDKSSGLETAKAP